MEIVYNKHGMDSAKAVYAYANNVDIIDNSGYYTVINRGALNISDKFKTQSGRTW